MEHLDFVIWMVGFPWMLNSRVKPNMADEIGRFIIYFGIAFLLWFK